MKLVKLTLAEGTEVFINPYWITSVRKCTSYTELNIKTIVFVKGSRYDVLDETEDVLKRIEEI